MERHGSIREEVVRRGREIYERSLSYELEPERLGELVVLDALGVENEVDEDEMRTCQRLAERRPNPEWRFFMKVGYNAAHGIGARPRRLSREPDDPRSCEVMGRGEDDARFGEPEDFPSEEDRIQFAPSDQIGAWEEIERWLPNATGFSVCDALVTDLSSLEDFMETDFDNPEKTSGAAPTTILRQSPGSGQERRSCVTAWT